MKLLELFAGSRSFGKEADKRGWEVCSSDIEEFNNINIVKSIFDLSPKDIPFIPDIIQASPPYEGFSVGSIGKHWNHDNTPKTENALLGVQLVQTGLDLVNYYLKLNSNLKWFMENPTGKLRKLDVVKGLPMVSVAYCQYGDFRKKPTDIWSNHIFNEDNLLGWIPRPMCKNGSPCHVAAPRGSKTGTQGMVNAYEKGKIPEQLCKEILNSCIN